jgi:hypothetical protein
MLVSCAAFINWQERETIIAISTSPPPKKTILP